MPGGDIEYIKELIITKKLNSNNIRFFVGYSGWSPNQLENELKVNSWIVTKTDSEMLLEESPENIWKKMVMWQKIVGDFI